MLEKTVLITGASRGLGRELLKQFIDLNWKVFPLVRDVTSISKYKNKCIPIITDVTDENIYKKIPNILDLYTPSLDLLINNAGIPGKAFQLTEVTTDEIKKLIDIHCMGVLRCIKAAKPFLVKSKNPIVINISSRLGSLTRNALGDFKSETISYSYRIAKAAQNMLTLCLSQELEEKGISVCSVHPGIFVPSSALDSRTTVLESAGKIIKLATKSNNELNGKYIDILSGQQIKW